MICPVHKNLSLMICLALLWSCGGKPANTEMEEAPTEEPVGMEIYDLEPTAESDVEPPQETNENQLKIVGSNIWVRSEPTNGEVVMKLNDGDIGDILDKKRFEYIRGSGHYWYRIVFESDTGWVFGSQTNQVAGVEVLNSPDKSNLWTAFQQVQIEKCRQETDHEYGECLINGYNMIKDSAQIGANELVLHYAQEGPTSFLYTINQTISQLHIFEVLTAQEGAAGISQSENFYMAFENDAGLELPTQPFEGKPIKIIEKEANEYFLISFKEYRNVLMYYSAFYNIYLVNTNSKTIQLVSERLGFVEGGGMMEDLETGDSYIHKVDIKFNGPGGFQLSEFSKRKTDSGWEELPEPKNTQYDWNNKQRGFLKN